MSVQKRPGGRYRARFRGPDGREIAKHFDRERDAKAWEAEQRTKATRGEWLDASARRTTFEEFATKWAAAQPWRGSTADRARSTLRYHLVPEFGPRPISSIRPSEVQVFVKKLSAGRSPGTVHGVLRIFKGVMRAAMADRLLAANPVEGVRATAYDPRVTIPSRAEVDALLEAAPGRYKALVVVAAGAGLRAGEALGLTSDRVRWIPKEIVVDRQLVTSVGVRAAFGPPKSKRSTRTVPAAGFVIDALAQHLERFEAGPDRLLFTDELARPVARTDFGRTWRAVQAAAGVDVRFHNLRHFCASTMLSANVPAPVVAEAMGHSVAELLRTYAHVLPDDRDRARQAIERAFADSARTGNGADETSALVNDMAGSS